MWQGRISERDRGTYMYIETDREREREKLELSREEQLARAGEKYRERVSERESERD
jgi:hypothetical protein